MCITIGCKQDTNTQHLHGKTNVFPMGTRLKLHATLLQKYKTQTHPLLNLNAHSNPPRNIKSTTMLYSGDWIHAHDTSHFFNCSQIPTQHHATNLCKKL